jgi:flagellar biogenesis protein FliO
MVTPFPTRHGWPHNAWRRMRPLILSALLGAICCAALGLAPQGASAQGQPPAGDPPPAANPPAGGQGTDPAPASAGTDRESLPIPEGSSGPVSVGGDLGGTMLRLLIGLVVVVALIIAVWQLMKRMQRGRYPALAETDSSLVSVLATTPLGPNRALHVVRVADTVVLVGATDRAVQSVATLDPESASMVTRALGPDDGGPGMAARARAMETSGGPASLLDRLRALSTRG